MMGCHFLFGTFYRREEYFIMQYLSPSTVLCSDTFMRRPTCRGVRLGAILHFLVVGCTCAWGEQKKPFYYTFRQELSLDFSPVSTYFATPPQNHATCLSFVLARFLVYPNFRKIKWLASCCSARHQQPIHSHPTTAIHKRHDHHRH